MIRSLCSLSLMLIVALAMAGCSDQDMPTTALQRETAPDLVANQNGPPESSGPHLIRYKDTFFYRFIDDETGVTAYAGEDIIAYCNDEEDPGAFDLVSYQEIQVPEDANRINALVKGGDVRASLWAFPPQTCPALLAATPIATGYADLRYTDNDVYIWLNPADSRNANAYGIRTNGALPTSGGETVRFNAFRRCVLDYDNSGDVQTYRCKEKVNYHFTE